MSTTDLASVMRARQIAAHTAPQHETTAPAAAPSPEVSSLKDGFRYGLALGFATGLGGLLILVTLAGWFA